MFYSKSTAIYCLIWLIANIILSPLIYFLLTSDIFGDHDWSIRSLLSPTDMEVVHFVHFVYYFV